MIDRNRSGAAVARLAFAAVLVAGLAACSEMQPATYTELHEIPDGPGLLSGDDGAFVVTRDRNKKTEETD